MRTALYTSLALLLVALPPETSAMPRPPACGAGSQGLCGQSAPAGQPVRHELSRGGGDQDRARDAYRSGDVLPLSQILRSVRRQYPGKLLDANLARRGGGYVYVIKLLDDANRVRLIQVDAQSGRVLSAR